MQQNQPEILQKNQRGFFYSGKTRDPVFRINSLARLKSLINKNEEQIFDALEKDLNKNRIDAYTSEIGYVLQEIDLAIKNLKKWSKPQKVKTSLINRPGRSWVQPEPYGCTLIIGPWNYPFGLLMAPVVNAMAAGNCIIAKPSEVAVNTANLIAQMIGEAFDEDYFAVVNGGPESTQSLINSMTDYIFFTGSTAVGKIISKSAAEHLIPATLELGGKNPCIVDKSADLYVSARRIAWGKFFNAGQTCVAPDYALVHRSVGDAFQGELVKAITEFYGRDLTALPDFTHIINERHFNRLADLMREGNIATGGFCDPSGLFISPTVITGVGYNSKIMQEEIFGPLLPVIFYDDLDGEIIRLRSMPKPLCIYFFSSDKYNTDKILNSTQSGSVCINGTINIIMSHHLPFGGIGSSGSGKYHGRAGFDTFSHKKSIMRKSFKMDQKYLYPPYDSSLGMLKKALKIIS